MKAIKSPPKEITELTAGIEDMAMETVDQLFTIADLSNAIVAEVHKPINAMKLNKVKTLAYAMREKANSININLIVYSDGTSELLRMEEEYASHLKAVAMKEREFLSQCMEDLVNGNIDAVEDFSWQAEDVLNAFTDAVDQAEIVKIILKLRDSFIEAKSHALRAEEILSQAVGKVEDGVVADQEKFHIFALEALEMALDATLEYKKVGEICLYATMKSPNYIESTIERMSAHVATVSASRSVVACTRTTK